MALMQVVCAAEKQETLFRACADCGRRTGNFCDGKHRADPCLAANHIPSEDWAEGQSTPFCNSCEERFVLCRFSRGVRSATPPAWGNYPKDWQQAAYETLEKEDRQDLEGPTGRKQRHQSPSTQLGNDRASNQED